MPLTDEQTQRMKDAEEHDRKLDERNSLIRTRYKDVDLLQNIPVNGLIADALEKGYIATRVILTRESIEITMRHDETGDILEFHRDREVWR